jgi:hypothetical protein
MSDQVGSLSQDMLAVIEKQERLAGMKVRRELLRDRAACSERDSEGDGDGGRHERGITQRGEIDPDYSVSESRSHILRNGLTEASLAHTARTGQGQERHRIFE